MFCFGFGFVRHFLSCVLRHAPSTSTLSANRGAIAAALDSTSRGEGAQAQMPYVPSCILAFQLHQSRVSNDALKWWWFEMRRLCPNSKLKASGCERVDAALKAGGLESDLDDDDIRWHTMKAESYVKKVSSNVPKSGCCGMSARHLLFGKQREKTWETPREICISKYEMHDDASDKLNHTFPTKTQSKAAAPLGVLSHADLWRTDCLTSNKNRTPCWMGRPWC